MNQTKFRGGRVGKPVTLAINRPVDITRESQCLRALGVAEHEDRGETALAYEQLTDFQDRQLAMGR